MNKAFTPHIVIAIILSANLIALTLRAGAQTRENMLQVSQGSAPGQFNLIYKSENRGALTIMIFDITGKYIYLKNLKEFNGDLKENIDISANPKGIYVFEIEDNNTRETKKVIYQ